MNRILDAHRYLRISLKSASDFARRAVILSASVRPLGGVQCNHDQAHYHHQQMPGARERGRMCSHRRRHTGCNLKCQRHCSKACDRAAEANPVLAEQIGGNERRNESAKAEEEVDKVEETTSMHSPYIP